MNNGGVCLGHRHPHLSMKGGINFTNPRLRTSLDVYNRLQWDEEARKWDPASIRIGYEDRFRGPMEIALLDFQPQGGDIPMHRVMYFRDDDEAGAAGVIWDRRRRLDLLFRSGLTERIEELSAKAKLSREEQTSMQRDAAAAVATRLAIASAADRAKEDEWAFFVRAPPAIGPGRAVMELEP
eukprot:Polyplicarium_translucidae@DN3798_c0_g1_i1.p4